MLLNDFSGGVNTRIAPNLLQPTQAQEYVNIENSGGTLKSLPGAVSTGIPIDNYFTYFNTDSEWVSKTTETDFVEYQDKLYFSDGTTLKYRSNLVESTLGIQPPVGPLGFLKANSVGMVTTTTADVGSLVLGSTVAYVVKVISGSLITYDSFSYTLDYPPNNTTKAGTANIQIVSAPASSTISLYRKYSGVYRLVSSVAYTANVIISDADINIGTQPEISTDYTEDIYTYCYTFYNSVEGIESMPNTISAETQIGNIKLTTFETTTDTKVDKIRIYRNGGALTNYTLVEEIPYTGLAIEYADTASDIDIAGNHILDSFNNTRPLTGLKYLTENYAMLFAAKGDKLYYSEIAKPYAWPSTNFIDFNDTITGIGAVSNGILVFTKYKTFIITGNSPTSFSKFLLSSSQGCLAHKTIQFVDNNLLWLSSDGICATNGGQIQLISMPILGKLDFLVTVYSAAVLDNTYYLSYSNALGDKLLVLDFRYNLMARYIVTQGSYIASTLDTLYQNYNGTLQKLLSGSDLTFTYKSPMLTEGKYSNYKTYKDMYIKYNGVFTINIYIDKTLNTTVSLNGDDVYNLKFQGLSKGYGLEIEIIGTGEIQEIEYNVVGRQNGK